MVPVDDAAPYPPASSLRTHTCTHTHTHTIPSRLVPPHTHMHTLLESGDCVLALLGLDASTLEVDVLDFLIESTDPTLCVCEGADRWVVSRLDKEVDESCVCVRACVCACVRVCACVCACARMRARCVDVGEVGSGMV